MTIRSFPWDSVDADRLYVSDDFSRLFHVFSRNGVFVGWEDALVVREAVPQAMAVRVGLGAAMIEGKFYQIYGSETVLTLADADSGNDRIDRVVLRLDRPARRVTCLVKEGTPAVNPVAPSITRNDSIYELSLAQVYVAEDVLKITTADITDERFDPDVCGDSVQAGMLSIKGKDGSTGHEVFLGDLPMNTNEIERVLAILFQDRSGDGKVKVIRPDTAEQELEFFEIDERLLAGSIADISLQLPEADPDSTKGTVFFTMCAPDDLTDVPTAQFNRWVGFSEENELLFGTHGHYFSTFDFGTRMAWDGSTYLRIFQNDMRLYFDGEVVHTFRSDGSKTGGSIQIGRTRYGMSPTDSPRSLISDEWEGMKVEGEKRIRLDPRLAKSLHRYGVWCTNPDVRVKTKAKHSFVLEGHGTTDVRLKGIRVDEPTQYFTKPVEELKQKGERRRRR